MNEVAVKPTGVSPATVITTTPAAGPDGLLARTDLPAAEPMTLSVRARRGLPSDLVDGAAESLHRLLSRPQPAPAAVLSKGA